MAVASNADGGTSVPLVFVETARQPRCFKGATATELDIDYHHSAEGWMNSALFHQWFDRFNENMAAAERNVLLLLDNVSCHRTDRAFSNIVVYMLPPNRTAHLQPQDAGVTRAFKARIDATKNRYYV